MKTKAMKKPIYDRIFIILFYFLPLHFSYSTELETLVLSLHSSDWFQAQAKQSKAIVNAIARDLPTQSWEINLGRETQPGDITEDFVSLQREFNSSWLQRVYREQSILDAKLQELDYSRQIQIKEMDVSKLFYDALRIQEELELRVSYIKALNDMLQKLEFRIRQGMGSVYDLNRLKQQQVLENQAIQTLEASLIAYKAQLQNLCLYEHEIRSLEGSLLPNWSEVIQNDQINKLHSHFGLSRASLEIARLEQNRKELENKFFKNYTLEFGTKRISEPNLKGSGSVVGMSAPFPLSDSDKRKRDKYQLMTQFQLSELNQQKSYLTARLRALSQLIIKTIQQSKDQQKVLIQSAGDLQKTREQAYQNGVGSLADLLDTRRHLLESHLQAQETKFKARQSWLEFKAVLIGVEP